MLLKVFNSNLLGNRALPKISMLPREANSHL
jgi:hypothetical protein